MQKKIERTQLQILFTEALNGATFTLIKGLNPFHIEINGDEYYIYIKNLSPAYFSNPDVWRVQLPIRDIFDEIKEADIPFILIGYDADYDVYTTWNPIWTKQRLNVAESVSFYSRRSLQEEVNRTKGFKRQSLNNDGEVVAFPRELLCQFFASYTGLFKGTGDYVAIGSKKRTEANEAYKRFSDSANVASFAKYMNEHSFAAETINDYSLIIKSLINDGVITQSRKIFLACDRLKDYLGVIDNFVEVHEVKEMNERCQQHIPAALRAYITFLISKEDSNDTKETAPEINLKQKVDLYKLITDPQVISDFEEYLASGNTTNGKAYNHNTINHYLRSILSLKEDGHFEIHKDIFYHYDSTEDLLKAFKEFLNCPEINRLNIEVHRDHSAALKQFAVYINQKFPTSTAISGYTQPEQSPAILQTPAPDIEYNEEQGTPEEIDWETRYTDSNGNLSKIANPKLIDQLRPFLDTEYRELSAAYNVIESFYGNRFKNMELSDWGRLINKIDWSNPYITLKQEVSSKSQEPQRKKEFVLRIKFPDGRVIQPNKVLEALIEVVKYAGPEKVHTLQIILCNDNLVLRNPNPIYAKACKPVSDGWLCNTCSSTAKKFQQIQTINEKLNLNLKLTQVKI